MMFVAVAAAVGMLAAFPAAHADAGAPVFEGGMVAVADTGNHRV